MKDTDSHIREENQELELSQSQSLIWLGQKLRPEDPLYNMAFTFYFDQPIQLEYWQQAWQEILKVSENLRTVFIEEDGQAKARVLPSLEYTIESIDFSSQARPKQAFQKWAKARNQVIFKLDEICFEVIWVKLNETESFFFMNFHHLIIDAWAVGLIYQNWYKVYKQLRNGDVEIDLSVPKFRDYLAHERSQSRQLKGSKTEEYWQAQLQKPITKPEIYGAKLEKEETKSQRIRVDLGLETSQAIRALAQEKAFKAWSLELSVFNVFATLLSAFIYRTSEQNQVDIGIPVHNRLNKELKETPGLFMELFPLRIDVKEEDSFKSLYQDLRPNSLELLKYARTGASNAALSSSFRVVLNFITVHFRDEDHFLREVEWLHGDHIDPGHHFRLQVEDMNGSGSYLLGFDFNVSQFSEAQMHRATRHFRALLEAFLRNSEEKIADIKLVQGAEYEELEKLLEGPKSELPGSLFISDFEKQCQHQPSSIALKLGAQTQTYQELNFKANQIAHYLKKPTIEAKSPIAVFMPRSLEYIETILGILKSGHPYVPIPANTPPKRLEYILKNSGASLMISHSVDIDRALEEPILRLDYHLASRQWAMETGENLETRPSREDLAYIMYTSGSTGEPKGVEVSHGALANYLLGADSYCASSARTTFPLFTSIGFDLTITSTFYPLRQGGEIHIYPENPIGPDVSLLEIIQDNRVNSIKLTPSHLALIQDRDLSESSLEVLIVGGENFKRDLAHQIQKNLPEHARIYNEYGPTEASVGCICHKYQVDVDRGASVPIGKPNLNIETAILNSERQFVPQGTPGELYLAGPSLARAYRNRPDLSQKNFITIQQKIWYKTGDWVRINDQGQFEYLGRKDQQIKKGGVRIELSALESLLKQHPDIQDVVADFTSIEALNLEEKLEYCVKCGLPSNYPQASFNEEGVCNLCHSFENYQKNTAQYFENLDALKRVFQKARAHKKGEYDCIMLLSGGKDSSYALAQLHRMGLKVLAFTLDNGFISEGAKENIRRIVQEIGVDHVFSSTPAMNQIFVDSLQRHSNVCNGCFKTIYTLSTQLALEKGIPIIVTGLSRGQFFETRLTEELFHKSDFKVEHIDETILEARKAYHQVNDAVNQLLDVSMFEDEEVYEKVQYLDFYRYCDVSLEEMLRFLDEDMAWERPDDTGRSTNCLINDLGIFMHKKERGYHNYAFPYSWDVRVGHKERDAALDELNDDIDEKAMLDMLEEINYPNYEQKVQSPPKLVLYYQSSEELSSLDLKNYLREHLAENMIPDYLIWVEAIPLSNNGKVDFKALRSKFKKPKTREKAYVAPANEIEEMIAAIWEEVLQMEKLSVEDDFIELGGNSLAAIRISARIKENLELEIPLRSIFEQGSVRKYANLIEQEIEKLLGEEE